MMEAKRLNITGLQHRLYIETLERQIAEKGSENRQLTSAYKEALQIAKQAQNRADIAERHWPAYRKLEKTLEKRDAEIASLKEEIRQLGSPQSPVESEATEEGQDLPAYYRPPYG